MFKELIINRVFRLYVIILLLCISLYSNITMAVNFDDSIEADLKSISGEKDAFYQEAERKKTKPIILKETIGSNNKELQSSNIFFVKERTMLYSIKQKKWIKNKREFQASGIIKKEFPNLVFFSKNNEFAYYTKLKLVTSISNDLELYANFKNTAKPEQIIVKFPNSKLILRPEFSYGYTISKSPFFEDILNFNSQIILIQSMQASLNIKTSTFPLGLKIGFGFEQFNITSAKMYSIPFSIGLNYKVPWFKNTKLNLDSVISLKSVTTSNIENLSTTFKGFKLGISKYWEKLAIDIYSETKYWSINSTNSTITFQGLNISADTNLGIKLTYRFSNLL